MNWIGSGFISIIVYATTTKPLSQQVNLITKDGSNLLTKNLDQILVKQNVT